VFVDVIVEAAKQEDGGKFLVIVGAKMNNCI